MTTGQTKTRTLKEILVSDTTATASSKHILIPRQINIKPHINALLVHFTQYIMSSFQQKIPRHAKRQKTTINKQTNNNTPNLKRQSIRTRLKYGRDFGIIRLGI